MNLPEGKPNFKPTPKVLAPILAESRVRAEALRPGRRELEDAASAAPVAPDFAGALRGETVRVIAEVKRRSPSVGPIDDQLDPARLAISYAGGGAAAISVLTEPNRFGGSLADLRAVVSAVTVPVLRKDFIVDELQLLEARAAGAAAALLIVRTLAPAELAHLITFAERIGLGVLTEAHTALEIAVALDAGARVVGVNARDLDTLVIDRPAAWELLRLVPSDVVAVAESGMATPDDVRLAAAAGADAVLVGSALVSDGDPSRAAREMGSVPRHGR